MKGRALGFIYRNWLSLGAYHKACIWILPEMKRTSSHELNQKIHGPISPYLAIPHSPYKATITILPFPSLSPSLSLSIIIVHLQLPIWFTANQKYPISAFFLWEPSEAVGVEGKEQRRANSHTICQQSLQGVNEGLYCNPHMISFFWVVKLKVYHYQFRSPVIWFLWSREKPRNKELRWIDLLGRQKCAS